MCSLQIYHFLHSGGFYDMKLNFCILTPKWRVTNHAGSLFNKIMRILIRYCILLFFFLSILRCIIGVTAPFQKIALGAMGGSWAFSFWQKKVSVKSINDSTLYFYILFRYFVGMDYFSTAIGTLIRYIFSILLKKWPCYLFFIWCIKNVLQPCYTEIFFYQFFCCFEWFLLQSDLQTL
jgi:hypothetical protein